MLVKQCHVYHALMVSIPIAAIVDGSGDHGFVKGVGMTDGQSRISKDLGFNGT